MDEAKINQLRKLIGVGRCVAEELLVLSGGDVDMAAECSRAARGLDQCKAAIINQRFRRIEADIDELWEEEE